MRHIILDNSDKRNSFLETRSQMQQELHVSGLADVPGAEARVDLQGDESWRSSICILGSGKVAMGIWRTELLL